MKWFPEAYTPYALMNEVDLSRREQRKIYSELRKKANRYQEAILRSKYGDRAAKRWDFRPFPTLSEIDNDRAFVNELSRLYRYMSGDLKNVTGYRRFENDVLDTLREHGYEGINHKNFLAFVDFMEQYRAFGLSKIYSSEQAVEQFVEAWGNSPTQLQDTLKAAAEWMESEN